MKSKYRELPWHKTWVGDAGVSAVVGLVVTGLEMAVWRIGASRPKLLDNGINLLGNHHRRNDYFGKEESGEN